MGCKPSKQIQETHSDIVEETKSLREEEEHQQQQEEEQEVVVVDPVEEMEQENQEDEEKLSSSGDSEEQGQCEMKEENMLEDVEEEQEQEADGEATEKSALRRIVIAGPPAGGKGTQCAFIAEKFGVVHLSTGDLLRSQISNETELGIKAKEFVENGELVPDELIISIVMDRLEQEDVKEGGWLLDGFPRTAEQAVIMKEKGIIPDTVIVLEIDDDTVVKRISGRRLDPVTGNTYHIEFNPCDDPEVEERLIQREDDTEEKIKIRLETYCANLQPIMDEFADVIRKVNADQEINAVSAEIEAALSIDQ